ncbi:MULTISPECIES: transcriptional regulator [unclassified Streptomyces]|uniref:transcriptional regulator n=1 Tax=unclassified Streptomyces TaxID=2593676 RepID=UPI00190AB602|nr:MULTISPECIES: transcriptional regulator [unclassified Streptomyces]MBK3567783.1 transcriptional regulator [Streptomyces sp. MBT62]MBK6017389.1 transcriptional regulator [Streptomyces sp. MBT53]
MTALRTTPTTPPPRLPVRDKAAAVDRAWGGVSPMLTRLAAEEATGVLVRERGSLHLVAGHVVHAESPSAPGLDLLLTAHGTLRAEAWEAAASATDDRHATTRLLLDGGLIGPGALELCQLGALYDAAYFVLAPSSTPGRFRYGVTHPLGSVRPVPVAALERETQRRRELLHRVWPDAATDGAPLLRADPVAHPPITPRQAAVLARVDGVRTAPEIARLLGRRAYPTLLDVRRLVSAGLVSPRPPAPPAVLPPPDVTDPDITLLKRLRDALEAL